MKKRDICAAVMLLLTVSLSACSGGGQERSSSGQIESIESIHISPSVPGGQELGNSSAVNVEEGKNAGYSILTYTEAPNENSSINIQYPFFEGEGKEALNQLIYGKVQEFVRIDGSLSPGDSDMAVEYQAEVTLQNEKMVSMVFWGTSSVSGGAYDTMRMKDFKRFSLRKHTSRQTLLPPARKLVLGECSNYSPRNISPYRPSVFREMYDAS